MKLLLISRRKGDSAELKPSSRERAERARRERGPRLCRIDRENLSCYLLLRLLLFAAEVILTSLYVPSRHSMQSLKPVDALEKPRSTGWQGLEQLHSALRLSLPSLAWSLRSPPRVPSLQHARSVKPQPSLVFSLALSLSLTPHSAFDCLGPWAG